VATGEVPVSALVASLRGRPGRRVAVGMGWVAGGAAAEVAAAVMAASTSGRHKTRLRDPGGQPLVLVSLNVGAGEPGALGGGGFGGRMVVEMMLSYACGRKWRKPPPLLREGVQGAGGDGLFDSAGHLVTFPGKVGDVFWAEVVVSGTCMLAYGGGVLVGEEQFVLVVVLP
jgi:hypothetical protein